MKNLVSLLIIFIITLSNSTAQPKRIVLENSTLCVEFNSKNGVLEKLTNKLTGWEIENRIELGLSFYMSVPLPHQRFNPVYGNKQDSVEYQLDEEEMRLTFIWKKLRSEKGGKLDITFKGMVQLKGDGLTFSGEIINNSKHIVEVIRWPQLGDISIPDKELSFSQKGIYYGGMNEFEVYPKFQNKPGYFAVDNPSNWMEFPYTPFVLLGNEKEGLYIGYHDTTARDLLQFKTELKPGYVSYELWDNGVNPKTDSIAGKAVQYKFYTTHFPFVLPETTVKLNPVVIQAYIGSWHKGADIYKEWRSSWFKPPHKPEWIKEVNSWQQIHMNNPEDDIRYTYNDLLEIGKQCAANGVKAIQVTGWTIGGQDSENPSHDTDPRLGTWQEFKDVIAEVRKLGVKIILFTKFTWADRSTDWYKHELIKYATKDPYGYPHYYSGYSYQTDVQLAGINTHRFAPMCHLSAEWREIANKEFIKTLYLGADGMLFDENQHHGDAKFCFDKHHGHKVPAYIFAGDETLARGFESIKNKINPDYIFAGEGHYDLENRQYHMSYFRVDLNHVPMQRYVSPNEEMQIAIAGYNDRNMVNTALLYRYSMSYEPRNFKGILNEFPMTVAYGKKMDALRKKYKSYLWEGTFHHIIGAKVLVDNAPYDKYSVFTDKETGNRAVVIVNFDYDKTIEVDIKFGEGQGKLLSATPENPDLINFNGKGVIPPNSAIIIFEKIKVWNVDKTVLK